MRCTCEVGDTLNLASTIYDKQGRTTCVLELGEGQKERRGRLMGLRMAGTWDYMYLLTHRRMMVTWTSNRPCLVSDRVIPHDELIFRFKYTFLLRHIALSSPPTCQLNFPYPF